MGWTIKMKNPLQQLSIVCFGILVFLFSNSLFADEWSLTRIGATYTIDISTSGSDNRKNLTGHFVGTKDDSKFNGIVYQNRGKTLIHFVQTNGTYVAIHSGIKIDNNTYSGVFYDNSGNEGRKFTLRRGGSSL
jgi:hypothetical protein